MELSRAEERLVRQLRALANQIERQGREEIAPGFSVRREVMPDPRPLFQEYVFRAAQQQNKALEEIAEKMLADGTQGIVMIQVEPEYDFRGGLLHDQMTTSTGKTMLGLHPKVPFGTIFEFPSMESFRAWTDRGWPIE